MKRSSAGHKQFVSEKQDFIIFFIAQDVSTATSHLKFISTVLNSSPMLAKQVKKENSDGIFLTNGLSILPQPPTIKSPPADMPSRRRDGRSRVLV
jgi:hypothetical protein